MSKRVQINSMTNALNLLEVSQRQIAASTTYSQSTISRIARGTWREVNYFKAVDILNAAIDIAEVSGQFDIEMNEEGMVKSVFFVY